MDNTQDDRIGELLGRVCRDLGTLQSLFLEKLEKWNEASAEYKTSPAGKRTGQMYTRYLHEIDRFSFQRVRPLHIRERNVSDMADDALKQYEECDKESVETCAYLKGYYNGIVAAAEELCTEFTCDMENNHYARI